MVRRAQAFHEHVDKLEEAVVSDANDAAEFFADLVRHEAAF
jgi:hypothetical protein